MSEFIFMYSLPPKLVPFSTIRGGISLFDAEICASARPRPHTNIQTNGHDISWILRNSETGEVFNAGQTYGTRSGALFSEHPLQSGYAYETLEVKATGSQSFNLRAPALDPGTATLGMVQGTCVMTAQGEKPVETLRVNDMLITRDRGLKPLRWIGHHTVTSPLKTVLFSQGSIKNSRDMRVCPDHMVVLKGPESLARFGQREVLLAARTFVNGQGILLETTTGAVFYQLLLDQHEVIYAEAAACESYLPSPANLARLTRGQRQEIHAAFPDLADDPASYGPMARYHAGATLH